MWAAKKLSSVLVDQDKLKAGFLKYVKGLRENAKPADLITSRTAKRRGVTLLNVSFIWHLPVIQMNVLPFWTCTQNKVFSRISLSKNQEQIKTKPRHPNRATTIKASRSTTRRKPATGGQIPHTVFERFVGKTSSFQIVNAVAQVVNCAKEKKTRRNIMTMILQTLKTRKAGLYIPIQTQTEKNKLRRELVGTEEYDNPEGPDAKYWNSNWIVGSCACLFC